VLALYALGLTVREMQAHLTELHGVEVSPDLISTVTDASPADPRLPFAPAATLCNLPADPCTPSGLSYCS